MPKLWILFKYLFLCLSTQHLFAIEIFCTFTPYCWLFQAFDHVLICSFYLTLIFDLKFLRPSLQNFLSFTQKMWISIWHWPSTFTNHGASLPLHSIQSTILFKIFFSNLGLFDLRVTLSDSQLNFTLFSFSFLVFHSLLQIFLFQISNFLLLHNYSLLSNTINFPSKLEQSSTLLFFVASLLTFLLVLCLFSCTGLIPFSNSVSCWIGLQFTLIFFSRTQSILFTGLFSSQALRFFLLALNLSYLEFLFAVAAFACPHFNWLVWVGGILFLHSNLSWPNLILLIDIIFW